MVTATKSVKVDLKQQLRHLYRPSAAHPELVTVPKMNFLMVDGKGDPNESKDFQEAIEALYGVAYTLKFMLKKEDAMQDFSVMPLEGLWWQAGRKKLDMDNKGVWSWTLMIPMPAHVKKIQVNRAVKQLADKKNPPALGSVRFESFREGKAVQIMHIGPYAEERPTIEKLHAFAKDNGFALDGKHHEIYLGDPRRAAPEKLKTIVRQPVVRKK